MADNFTCVDTILPLSLSVLAYNQSLNRLEVAISEVRRVVLSVTNHSCNYSNDRVDWLLQRFSNPPRRSLGLYLFLCISEKFPTVRGTASQLFDFRLIVIP